MKSSTDLKQLLKSIDHKSYPAYKDTKGSYQFGSYTLSIDHVQGDPFASPSKISIHVEHAKASFPAALYDLAHKRIALQDYLIRLFYTKVDKYNFKAKGSGKSGLLSISKCGQEILERTACSFNQQGSLTVRMEVGFPANGRSINSSELIKILFDFLPECVESTFFYKKLNPTKVESIIQLAEDQQYIREQLPKLGLTAFVADGSILPRETGVSARPMKDAIPFFSPESMQITLHLPYHGPQKGMGIKKGITLIVGGGYHGKSTLLKALESGVYNHIAGDGREYVITDDTALKIRAEDGRSIKHTDISMFVNNLPNDKDTHSFSTQDASGSTSQAANVIEGMESGTSLFLIDEDTCATNFMIRDELMQRVVHPEQEPITPFIGRARSLYEQHGISSILVAGSSGAYFHIADRILQMARYKPKDITEFAKKEAASFSATLPTASPANPPSFLRIAKPNLTIKNDNRVKVKTLGKDSLQINKELIDLRLVEQLTDSEQTAALGYMIIFSEKNLLDGKKDLRTIVSEIFELIARKGLTAITESSYPPIGLALPRKQEVFACFNRYRDLHL